MVFRYSNGVLLAGPADALDDVVEDAVSDASAESASRRVRRPIGVRVPTATTERR